MAKKRKSLATVWTVPDNLWQQIEPILLTDAPPKSTGRPRANLRQVFDGIIFRLRTGCQWSKIPAVFGDDSTIHRWFQRWCERGVMLHIWNQLVTKANELEMIDWRWQCLDGSLSKTRFGGIWSALIRLIEASQEQKKIYWTCHFH